MAATTIDGWLGRRSRPRGCASGGFTLVELLVVIAVIGVLVSLILPAVQAAREAGRRAQCSNNLKQMGVAFHLYHDTHRQFPSAYISQPGGPNEDPDTLDAGPGWAWGALLLPFLEQQPLHDQFDHELPCWDPAHAAPAQTTLEVYLCPSASGDRGPFRVLDKDGNPLATFGRSHYVANVGQDEPWGYTVYDYASIADGPLFRNSTIRAADVTDGLTSTVFLGEHHPVLSNKTWVGVVPGAAVCPTPKFAFSECDEAATLVQVHSGPSANELPPAIHPPNSPLCHVCQMYAHHPGGCNVLLGDGSVRFISATINQLTWAALSSRAGGEVVGEY
jgi:prepilin-type N-terminal cleavage/methylation domain-containing protein/prepilin-type processing-associated H-X9-DG protein